MATTTKSKPKVTVASLAADVSKLTEVVSTLATAVANNAEATKVAHEAATKSASGRRRRKDLVLDIANDGKGHFVGVILYADGGAIRVRMGWTTKSGQQYRDIPLETYRLLMGNVDEVEAAIAELDD